MQKRYARALQVFFPELQNLRFALNRLISRHWNVAHEQNYLGFPLLNLGDGPIFDIGANRGQSIETFRFLLPERQIVSFEPAPNLASSLSAIYRDDTRVTVIQCALGERAGIQPLYTPRYRRWTFDGLASTDREQAMTWLRRETIAWFNPRHLKCLSAVICVLRIDDLDIVPSAIKIDTQGSEILVLRGAERILRSARPAILLECATAEIIEFMGSLGYAQFLFRDGRFRPYKLTGQNTFFLTSDHLDGIAHGS